MKDRLRILVGLVFWISVIAASWNWAHSSQEVADTSRRLLDHARSAPRQYAARFPLSAPLAVGNPLRVRLPRGFFVAGHVASVKVVDDHQEAQVAIYPEYAAMMGADTRLIAARTAGDVAWVIRTLLPEDTQKEIKRIVTERWREHKSDLLRDLQPGLVRLLEDSLTLLQEELPAIVRSHKRELDVMGDVLRHRGWEGHLEDVFTAILWPIVKERAAPLLDSVGDEIVAAFPVWSMSWAYLAESIPFTDKDRFEKKVRAFIKEKAIPIIESRQDEMRRLAAGALRDTIKDERTVKEMQDAFFEVSHDPRFRRALQSLLKALFLNNPRFQSFARDVWKRPDLRGPVDRFLESFEPAIRRVANRLLMNESRDGINPDLARVLRRKLLREDEDWVRLELGSDRSGAPPDILPGVDGGRQ